MTNNQMAYRGYCATFCIDSESGLYRGTIVGIKDLVTFYAKSVLTLETSFHEAVDDYIEQCAEIGKLSKHETSPMQQRIGVSGSCQGSEEGF